jgi:hypothetical protein
MPHVFVGGFLILHGLIAVVINVGVIFLLWGWLTGMRVAS